MKKTKLLSAAAITASIVLLLLIIAASIPYRIDRLLLQEDGIVCSSSTATSTLTITTSNDTTRNIANNNSMDWTTLLLHTSWMDYMLMRFLLHVFWKANNNNNSSSSSDLSDKKKIMKHHPSSLHPICTKYRELRSTIQIQQICIPWNWYRSKQFQLRRSAVRSSTVVRGTLLSAHSRPAVVYDRESFGTYCIHLESPTTTRSSDSDNGRLPPAVRVRSVDVEFRSWTKPVISAQINGVEINIVVQKGKRRLARMSSFRKLNGNHPDAIEKDEEEEAVEEDKDAVSVLIGDMTIREAIRTLPNPPEREGMYPMIGLVNVTNVAVNVMERVDGRENDRRHYLYPVNRIGVPDEIFAPLLNLTWANQVQGLDRFHFNSHLESAFSDAFRRHLFNEAEKALRTSMAAAMDFREMILEQNNKLHEQFRALVEKTQQLYIEKWLELGIGAIKQTKEGILHDLKNITAPLSHAFRAWSQDVQNVILDSRESPLKVVMMHHWDQIMNWIDHHDFTFTTLQPSSKGLHPTIWSTIHTLASRSKDSIDELVATCEDEIRDMWMAWHLQFMPVLE